MSTLIERAVLALIGLAALTATVVAVLHSWVSEPVFGVVAGALGVSGVAVAAALAAMHASAEGVRPGRGSAML